MNPYLGRNPSLTDFRTIESMNCAARIMFEAENQNCLICAAPCEARVMNTYVSIILLLCLKYCQALSLT